MNQPDNPQELADLIDSLMAEGSGHVNIRTDGDNSGIKVDVLNSTDFCGNKGACCQPTEEDAVDNDED